MKHLLTLSNISGPSTVEEDPSASCIRVEDEDEDKDEDKDEEEGTGVQS